MIEVKKEEKVENFQQLSPFKDQKIQSK